MKPFFSIVVVAFNAEKTIGKTIESVLCQSFSNYEIVVKDAKSTDSTIKSVPNDLRISVYSESDAGIYDGMNEAISKTNGQYILFLNCGDLLFDSNILLNVHKFIVENVKDTNSIVYGNYMTGEEIHNIPQKITKSFLFRKPICHQTMFFGRELFDRYGVYDIGLSIRADYEYTLRTFTHGVAYYHCGDTVCIYEGGGVSSIATEKSANENRCIRKIYYSKYELIAFKLKEIVTMTRVRVFITSNRSPKWMR